MILVSWLALLFFKRCFCMDTHFSKRYVCQQYCWGSKIKVTPEIFPLWGYFGHPPLLFVLTIIINVKIPRLPLVFLFDHVAFFISCISSKLIVQSQTYIVNVSKNLKWLCFHLNLNKVFQFIQTV